MPKPNKSKLAEKLNENLMNDPAFNYLGEAGADMIDKMKYLSKKELAKHKALKTTKNFE
jgi:hypothetical protein